MVCYWSDDDDDCVDEKSEKMEAEPNLHITINQAHSSSKCHPDAVAVLAATSSCLATALACACGPVYASSFDAAKSLPSPTPYFLQRCSKRLRPWTLIC